MQLISHTFLKVLNWNEIKEEFILKARQLKACRQASKANLASGVKFLRLQDAHDPLESRMPRRIGKSMRCQ